MSTQYPSNDVIPMASQPSINILARLRPTPRRRQELRNRTISRARRPKRKSRVVTTETNSPSITTTDVTISPARLETIDEVPHTINNNGCAICMAPFTGQKIGTPDCCSHNFCLDCLKRWAQVNKSCPLDRQAFRSINIRRVVGGRVIGTLPKKRGRPRRPSRNTMLSIGYRLDF